VVKAKPMPGDATLAPRGYLTLATGRRGYLEMAVDMALSLREHTELPVGLAADGTLARLASERFGSVFDAVRVIDDRFLQGRIRKYGVAEASPFEEVVFVDADCIVLGPLDHLFASLGEHDVAMLGEQLTREDDENHHGFSTRRLMERFELERYLKTNSGLFGFRRAPAREIMDAWRSCYLDEVRPGLKGSILLGRWMGDEIAIGIVGGRLGLGTLPAPHAMFWPQEFDSIDLDAPAKPLLHMIWPPPPDLLARLLSDMHRRRVQAGVPPGGTEHWQAEVGKLTRMRWRRRVLERIGWW